MLIAIKIEENLAGELAVPCGSSSYLRFDGRWSAATCRARLNDMSWDRAVVVSIPSISAPATRILYCKGVEDIPTPKLLSIVNAGSY